MSGETCNDVRTIRYFSIHILVGASRETQPWVGIKYTKVRLRKAGYSLSGTAHLVEKGKMESFTEEVCERVFSCVVENPLIQRFLSQKGEAVETVIEECMTYLSKYGISSGQAPASFVFNLDYAKTILRPNFDSGLILDGKHCINIFPRRTTIDKPPHKACAAPSDGIFCEKCYKPSKHESIVKDYEAGKFSLADYAKKKTAAAIADAKSFCRQVGFGKHDVESYTQKRDLNCVTYRYNRSLLYDAKDTRVVVRRIANEELVMEYRAVGIDRHYDGKLTKLTRSDVMALKDTSVVFDMEMLDDEAAEEVQALLNQ